MDDLTELQSRVAAAQERLQQSAEEERRYGLRLNDIVAIVEGSLARQRDEVEKLKAEIAEVRGVLGKVTGERDEAKGALIQAHHALSAAQMRLGQREVQNEQLRRMLLDLLAAIESRKGNAVPDVVRRLEGGIQAIMKQDKDQPQTAGIAASAPSPAPDSNAPRAAAAPTRRLTVVATVSKMNETAGPLALAPHPSSKEAQLAQAVAEEDFEEPAAQEQTAESEPEALSDIAMSEAGTIVAEPEADAPPAEAASPQEQQLVNALLDAERKLIEAEASGSAANASSPVAEIIRRISQRTREIGELPPQS